MTSIHSFLTALFRDRRGQDLLEYALLAGLAAACAVASWSSIVTIGAKLDQLLQAVAATIIGISAAS